MIATLFIALFVLLFLGTPVFVALGLSAVLALVGFSDLPLMGVAQRLINGVDKFSLLAVPFFIFAANVMKNGGIAKRIMNWAKTMVGSSRGSLAVTTEVSCMFFGAVSGSSPATVVAMGSMMYPELIKEKYPKRFSLGLITAAGSVAILIPPSINMIVYGTVTGASVGALFMGGIGAGLIYGLAYIVYCLWYAKKYNIPKGKKSTGREKWAATKDAAWALGVPVIIMGGICLYADGSFRCVGSVRDHHQHARLPRDGPKTALEDLHRLGQGLRTGHGHAGDGVDLQLGPDGRSGAADGRNAHRRGEFLSVYVPDDGQRPVPNCRHVH